MVCAGPYLLGVGRWAGHEDPCSQSLLCLSSSWASGIGFGFVAFLPHQQPPIRSPRSPPHWDPQPPYFSWEQARARDAQVGPSRAGRRFQEEGAEEGWTGPWRLDCGRRAGAPSGKALAGRIQTTPEAAVVGEAVTAWGRGEPRAPQPGAALSWPAQPGVWPLLGSGLLGCVASALAAVQLHPGLSRPWGSDPQSHQCPRAADLLEAIGSADGNEVFLGEEGEGPQSASGQGKAMGQLSVS